MKKNCAIEEKWGAGVLSTDQWPPVCTSTFSEQKRKKYNQRKRALELSVNTDLTKAVIAQRTGISVSALTELRRRAFEADNDGNPYRFSACIPNFRLKKYSRTDKSESGRAGRFTQFLTIHSEIQELLDAWALGKRRIHGTAVRGKRTELIWKAFVHACKENDIDLTGYPFTNADGGKEAVRRYCEALRKQNFVSKSRVEHGDQAGRLAAQSHTASNSYNRLPLRPYDRVQLDGHKLDLLLTVELINDDGDAIHLPVSRVWLLVTLDCASRAVLGYSVSLLENYSNEDVLQCVCNSIEPWSKKVMPAATLGYAKGAGLPSGVINGCAWRMFDALQFDNAYSHLSSYVQERIIGAGLNEVQTNKPISPRSDALVERFFKTFEEMSLHQLPMTTGSDPKDARRKNPEKEAVGYQIQLDDLHLIVDIAIANYNATPHESLHGRTPLEFLELQLKTGRCIPRYATGRSVDGLALFERDYGVTIRMNSQQGHRPYVKFKGVRYSGAVLEGRADLANMKATFRVNIRDIRRAQLFLNDGTLLGVIDASSNWMLSAHSIQIRQAINRLVKANKLSVDTQCPLSAYMEYLRERAKRSKKARSKLLNVSQRAGTVDAPASIVPTKKRVHPSARSGWISLGIRSNR